MKDPFEIWYEESGHRFDHGGDKRGAMEIAFTRGEIVGMERAMDVLPADRQPVDVEGEEETNDQGEAQPPAKKL